jgi:hypothetical protein
MEPLQSYLRIIRCLILRLSNVLHILYLHRNLVSISQLDDDKFNCYFFLEIANVRYYFIMSVLVLPSDKTTFLSIISFKNVNDVSNKNEKDSSSRM